MFPNVTYYVHETCSAKLIRSPAGFFLTLKTKHPLSVKWRVLAPSSVCRCFCTKGHGPTGSDGLTTEKWKPGIPYQNFYRLIPTTSRLRVAAAPILPSLLSRRFGAPFTSQLVELVAAALPFLMQMCANRKHCSSAWFSNSVTLLCSGLFSCSPERDVPFQVLPLCLIQDFLFPFDKQPGGMARAGSLSKLCSYRA